MTQKHWFTSMPTSPRAPAAAVLILEILFLTCYQTQLCVLLHASPPFEVSCLHRQQLFTRFHPLENVSLSRLLRFLRLSQRLSLFFIVQVFACVCTEWSSRLWLSALPRLNRERAREPSDPLLNCFLISKPPWAHFTCVCTLPLTERASVKCMVKDLHVPCK